MIKEYLDLHEAIWKQAVDDDINEVKKHLSSYGFERAYRVYIRNATDPLEMDNPKFKKIKKDIEQYSVIKTREIEKRIKELVFEEAKQWPYNKRLKNKDDIYNSILKKIKNDVKVFSEERMENRWRGINESR